MNLVGAATQSHKPYLYERGQKRRKGINEAVRAEARSQGNHQKANLREKPWGGALGGGGGKVLKGGGKKKTGHGEWKSEREVWGVVAEVKSSLVKIMGC